MAATRLVQLFDESGARRVVWPRARARESSRPWIPFTRLRWEAIAAGGGLAELAVSRALDETVDLDAAEAEGRLLPPLDHPDPAHMLVSGTGLTHLGSAESRDKMHRTLAGEAPLSDSMKMFKLGIEGGKPAAGPPGAQPEWFYKGDGSILAPPGGALALPAYALDGGEESEIVGLYVIVPDGIPWRLGFALGNEFSDHVMERHNYLNLAHSKLRACAFGPELRLGPLPGRPCGQDANSQGRPGGVGGCVPFRRGQHVPLAGQPRTSPLQVRPLPPAGRRSRPFLRHLDAQLLGRLQARARRYLRNRDA